jgi:hypothetical protein
MYERIYLPVVGHAVKIFFIIVKRKHFVQFSNGQQKKRKQHVQNVNNPESHLVANSLKERSQALIGRTVTPSRLTLLKVLMSGRQR